ncbi:hypothetical protein [Pseudomonas sp. RIT-PI-AD]|uniref:hypothetical protein n=1 Tax=Pseudomonas sp. RIT-PI-AD TaxID=3035294 RepID=UPI0021D96712|nr:hypothetical protein [Pseudomonas sp. RIT-PI-AD]
MSPAPAETPVRGRRGWKRVGLALLLVAALGLALCLRDEPLDDGARDALRADETKAPDDPAYLYLLGLDAAEGEPQALGRRRLEDYRAALARHPDGADLGLPAYPALALPEGLCDPLERACRARREQDPVDTPVPWERHAELLRRYHRAMAFASYRSSLAPGLAEPLPALRHLLNGNLLLNAQAWSLARTEGGAALRLLEDDLAGLRRRLAQADQMVLKLVLLKMIQRDLDSLAWLYQRGALPPPSTQAPLSEAERSLRAPMRREFALVARGLLGLRADGMADPAAGFGERLGWALFYKPRMTVNRVWPRYRQVADTAALDAPGFARALRADPPAAPSSDWRNPVGAKLLRIGLPDWNAYLARFHDLDGKLRLFQRLREGPAGTSPDAQRFADLPGLYGPGDAPVWDAAARSLCYPGPYPDPRGLRCLDLR